MATSSPICFPATGKLTAGIRNDSARLRISGSRRRLARTRRSLYVRSDLDSNVSDMSVNGNLIIFFR